MWRRMCITLLVVTASSAHAQWMESKSAHYSIYYEAGYEHDAELAKSALDSTEKLMSTKYGVMPDRFRMSIYLHTKPEAGVDVNTAWNRCCTAAEGGIRTGTIDILAPS